MDTVIKLDSGNRVRVESAPEAWDEADFAGIFRQQYARLAGVAMRLVGDRAQAEEMAAEALWRLYRAPDLQAEGNNIPGWLFRTVTRLALDGLRSRRRWRILMEAAAVDPETARVRAMECPSAAFDQRQRAHQVRAALRRLKPQQAQMLWLRHSGYSYQEIASAMEIKPASVGTTLARAEVAFARSFRRGNHERQS